MSKDGAQGKPEHRNVHLRSFNLNAIGGFHIQADGWHTKMVKFES